MDYLREKLPTQPLQFPFNLLQTVQHSSSMSFPFSISQDHLAGLQYALFTLPELSRKWVLLQFEQNLSDEEIMKSLNLSVQGLKALALNTQRKLRNPSRWNWICYGIEGNMKRLLEQTRADSYRQGYYKGLEDAKGSKGSTSPDPALLSLPIQGLALSPRSLNALSQAGLSTLGDLAALDEYQIMAIRGLGAKNAGILARTLAESGLSGTAWEKFLRP